MNDKSILEKIINEIPMASGYDPPEFYENSNKYCSVVFYSTMKPEMIIEKARKYLHMPYYSIDINCLYSKKNAFKIYISTYTSGERIGINFGANLILGCTELDNGFIYKYMSPFPSLYPIGYMYIPNFDIIMKEDRPSRKRETLAFYCKLLSYETANKVYKKYTGKGISKTTYLKYNLG